MEKLTYENRIELIKMIGSKNISLTEWIKIKDVYLRTEKIKKIKNNIG
jgi:hypothetical protein